MNTVVYYPQIYPTPEWLKLAALCWDKVFTLVPSGEVDEVDSDLVELAIYLDKTAPKAVIDRPFREILKEKLLAKQSDKLLQKSTTENKRYQTSYFSPRKIRELDAALGGVLASVEVAHLARDPLVQEQFGRWLDARAEKFKIKQQYSGKSIEQKMLGKLLEDEYVSLYQSKFDNPDENNPFFAMLRKHQEIRFENVQIPELEALYPLRSSNFIYLPKDIALNYLTLCASKAAKDIKSDLVTGNGVFTDTIFYDLPSLRGEITKSLLQVYLPKDYFNLEPKRIAEFRSEFASRRLKYQAEIQSIVDQYSNVASEGELEIVKKSIIEIAQEQVEETKKTYQRAKLDLVLKTFSITLTPPAIAASIASIIGIGIVAPAGIAATLSLFAAQTLLDWDRAESEKSKSPWSYVLDLKKIK